MSRSYRHTTIIKDKNNKSMKKYANKKVRHTDDIPNGKAYKKCFESYDISDYRWIWTKEQAIDEWRQAEAGIGYTWLLKHFKNLEEYLAYWRRCVKRK